MTDTDFNSELAPAGMSAFASWLNLESDLKARRDLDEDFLSALVAGALEHRVRMKRGWRVHRARLMSVAREFDAAPYMCTEMAPPPPELTKPGRANPAGVPYFYGALDPRTAVLEMRPWRGARMSIAKFEATRGLSLVDLTGKHSDVAQSNLMSSASFMMARPVHRDDADGYLATQSFANRISASGIDGILYASAMRSAGTNVVLFSDAHLKCTRRDLLQVGPLSVKYSMLWDGRKPNGGW